jgi:hypothetical protein
VVLPMSRPWRHPRTGFYWFRKAIPGDLRQILGKREEKFSLRTKNPTEAQALHASRAAEIAEKWARLRGYAQPDHADLFGLAGEFYRDMLAKNQRDPGGLSLRGSRFDRLLLRLLQYPQTSFEP